MRQARATNTDEVNAKIGRDLMLTKVWTGHVIVEQLTW